MDFDEVIVWALLRRFNVFLLTLCQVMGACSDRPGGKVLEKDSPKNLLHNHKSVCVWCFAYSTWCPPDQAHTFVPILCHCSALTSLPTDFTVWSKSLKRLQAAIKKASSSVVLVDRAYSSIECSELIALYACFFVVIIVFNRNENGRVAECAALSRFFVLHW